MKCLSLMQPWATLVVLGAKSYETRNWATAHRGLLAIHASKRIPGENWGLCSEEPFRTVLRGAGFYAPADLPVGKVLGTVEVLDVVRASALDLAELGPYEFCFGDFGPGRYAWKLANPIAWPEPIVLSGRPGVFEIALDKMTKSQTPKLPFP